MKHKMYCVFAKESVKSQDLIGDDLASIKTFC